MAVVFSPVSGIINTFGNWVEIIASTALILDLHRFVIAGAAPNDGSYRLEVGTGAALSEATITSADFYIDSAANSLPRQPLEIICPRIPAGTRVAVRIKGSVATQTINFRFGYHMYPE